MTIKIAVDVLIDLTVVLTSEPSESRAALCFTLTDSVKVGSVWLMCEQITGVVAFCDSVRIVEGLFMQFLRANLCGCR